MTQPTWPAALPQAPLLHSWSETPERNVAQFQPEAGPPKYRRRNTANGAMASAQFIMTPIQVGTFDEFFETTLKDGTLPFYWKHPTRGTTYSWCFANEPEKAKETIRAQRVTVQLRRLP